MPERVLFIGAHLDDAAISSGGLIRKLANAGYEVSVVCFGNGDEAFVTPDGRAAAVERFGREAIEAHRILGVANFECYDVPDFGVSKNRDDYRQCIRAIRRFRPKVVFGHYWKEYFQHHDMASQSRDAWYQAAWECSGDLGAPWKPAHYYHFEVLQMLPEPTHLVDVSDTFDAELEALRAFGSTQEHLGGLARQLETRAAYYGAQIGVRYAEAFRQSFFLPEAVLNPEEIIR